MNPYFTSEEYSEPSHHSLWVEKYRPTTLNDYVGNDVVKETMSAFIEKNEIPHILLYGPTGTGKTTLGKMLIRHIPCDFLIINASDENGVDDVRTKIQDFSVTMGNYPLKIIFLDEADRLTPDAQGILRNLMETYSEHTRFILTCNYHEKISPAIKSRCQSFEIKPSSKKDYATILVKILMEEKVKFDVKDVGFVVNSYFPDFRKIINFSQQSSIKGSLNVAKENVINHDYKMKLVDLLQKPTDPGTFQNIRQLVADASFSNYEEVYKFLFDNVSVYASGREAGAILELADAVYQSAIVFEREITFVAAMHKLLKVLK